MDVIGNIKDLKNHIKKSKNPYKDAILDYYKLVGETQGYTTLKNTPAIANGIDYGKIDLVWAEPNIIFMCEFGLPEDLYKSLFKATVIKPAKAVIILSSKSRCKPQIAQEIILKTPELKKTEYEIVDIA
jgi:hypothetical protein